MSTPSSTTYAKALIARLDLEPFIRRWNNGEGSIITSYGALLDGLAFKRAGLAAFEAAMDEAAADGCEGLDDALRATIEPLIFGTATIAILKICDDWAEAVVAAEPEIVAQTRPFSGAQAFIDQALAQHAPPDELCGPNGEDILDAATIETLLRRALGSLMAETRTSGRIEANA